MENIDNMGRNSLEALARDNLTQAGRKKLFREIVAGAVTLSLLAAGLLYTCVLKGTQPVIPQLLYFLGFLIEGVPVIVAGLRGVFTKNLTNAMEILVGIAIVGCVFNRQLILALLIPLILNLVHLLEERSIMGGRAVIEGLKKMQQTTAVRQVGGGEETVDVSALSVGDVIVVRPGAGVPVDGVVLTGESHIDQKSLTGEPQPIAVTAGSPVYAGTVNLSGLLTVRVEKEYVDSSFAKILQLLEKSEGISVPESRLIDRFLAYYIPFVLAVAALVALISKDASKAIAVLVVACPCGQMLVSAAPMIAALSAATKRGILIKNAKFVEELTKIDTVVFDKTGTVTCGELALDGIYPADGVEKDALVAIAATAAAGSDHPISRALTADAGDRALPGNWRLTETAGGGMTATLGIRAIRFGRLEWLQACGCVVPENFAAEATGSVSYVAEGKKFLGCLSFNDTVRAEAADSVAALRDLGVTRTVMLTGDRPEPAEKIGRAVGVDEVHAGLLPGDKLEHMKALTGEEHGVLAVGDGINDALALRAADVGIAMGAMGSDVAIDSADIALMNNDLSNVPFAVSLARKTRRIIYQNLVLSICSSALMIALSAFGFITALAGAILHNCGAFLVLLNSSRILRH